MYRDRIFVYSAQIIHVRYHPTHLFSLSHRNPLETLSVFDINRWVYYYGAPRLPRTVNRVCTQKAISTTTPPLQHPPPQHHHQRPHPHPHPRPLRRFPLRTRGQCLERILPSTHYAYYYFFNCIFPPAHPSLGQEYTTCVPSHVLLHTSTRPCIDC